jgi:hypothetical protein
MRRFFGPGLGLLLGFVVASSATAQRSPTPATTVLHEPRADPVLPVALFPFTIAPEVCRQGHVPRISLKAYNSLSQTVAVLHLRDRPNALLDSLPLRCGDYVARWDGTVDGGTRAASPGLYFFVLSADGGLGTLRKLILTAP